jgi:hypothetical protein
LRKRTGEREELDREVPHHAAVEGYVIRDRRVVIGRSVDRQYRAPVESGLEVLDLGGGCHVCNAADRGVVATLALSDARRPLPTGHRRLCPADLPDAELEKIGVSLGHRRKILAAVADSITEPKRRETAERLQLTDMLFKIHKSPLSGFRGDTVPIGAGEPAEGERMTRIMKGSEMLGASAINLCPVLRQFGVLVVGRPSRLDAASEKYGPRRHPGRDQSSLTR